MFDLLEFMSNNFLNYASAFFLSAAIGLSGCGKAQTAENQTLPVVSKTTSEFNLEKKIGSAEEYETQKTAEVKKEEPEYKAKVTAPVKKEVIPAKGLVEVTKDNIGVLYNENVVIDFWAPWCGPCVKRFGPFYHSMAEKYADSNVVFAKINFETDKETIEKLLSDGTILNKIDCLPYVIYLKDGKQVDFMDGGGQRMFEEKLRKNYSVEKQNPSETIDAPKIQKDIF
jgi:thiol-disulfide isomerase/thioredoxin